MHGRTCVYVVDVESSSMLGFTWFAFNPCLMQLLVQKFDT